MSISGRDLVDRVVPALARFVPLEDRVLADAKYQARAAALEAATRQRTAFDLVILGDSHAEYAGDPRLFPGIEMLNLGIARDTTVGVLRRLGAMPDSIATRYVLVEIGYNDLKYRAVAATAENIARIVASIGSRWPGKPTIFVQGLFPVAGRGRIRMAAYAN